MNVITFPGALPVKLGRPPLGEKPMTKREQNIKYRAEKRISRLSHIAVLDMETDPFQISGEEIQPFCAELYSDQFGAIVIWDEDYGSLVEKLIATIEALPDRYTIYAHNGGKFDFMFFVHKLRGIVRFKGRAIMSAKIGSHELRDSLHILPEKLAAWKKDRFDYRKMLKRNRNRFRDEILKYLHSDCVYLFDFVKRFTREFGLKISIGQAAFAELKKHYRPSQVKEHTDAALRPFFLGGRVECIGGMGLFESWHWQKPYKLYDVNSMYPFVMATRHHPIGNVYDRFPDDAINENTVFLDLTCDSYGAFFVRTPEGELTMEHVKAHRFQTTIWEYETALKYNLIDNVKIHWRVDCRERTTFKKFIVPMYDRRNETKQILYMLDKRGERDGDQYEETKKENIFLKYLLNNSYGKFAQNPSKYKEYCYTPHGKTPAEIGEPKWFDFMPADNDGSEMANDIRHDYGFPIERTAEFDVWARPSPGRRYNNVGTAASITGAARAILLEARERAIDPIYCDTDSLICRDLPGFEIDEARLGAWKIEEIFDDVIITGKKTYCCKVAGLADGHERRLKVRSKGADLRIRPTDAEGFEIADATAEQWLSANNQTWRRYLDILDGEIITAINRAPTFSKTGQQSYLTRRIRATAPLRQRQFGDYQHGASFA